MALPVRCDTSDAQLEALPKTRSAHKLLSSVGVLTSTAVVLMHKVEQDELIIWMPNTKRGNESVHYGKRILASKTRASRHFKEELEERLMRERVQGTYEQQAPATARESKPPKGHSPF